LTAPDLLLRGYLKEKVFFHRPQYIEELKNRICQKARNITKDILRGCWTASATGSSSDFANMGDYVMDKIFKNYFLLLSIPVLFNLGFA
jgi:hypothetical protein